MRGPAARLAALLAVVVSCGVALPGRAHPQAPTPARPLTEAETRLARLWEAYEEKERFREAKLVRKTARRTRLRKRQLTKPPPLSRPPPPATPPSPPSPPRPPRPPPGPPPPPPPPATAARAWWGDIRGSPPSQSFSFSHELGQKCADASAPFPLLDLPLSLSPNTFRQILMSQEASDGHAYGNYMNEKYRRFWNDLHPYLPPTIGDIISIDNKYSTCAVVGNNGNLLHGQLGKIIDAHSKVIRLNKGPTRGFKQHVGLKTDFRFMNKKHFRIFSLNGKSHGHTEELPQDSNATYLASRMGPILLAEAFKNRKDFEDKYSEIRQQNITLAPVSFNLFRHANTVMRAMKECMALRGSEPGDFTSATSGTMAVLLATQLCEQVTVVGIGEQPLTPLTPYQYFFGVSGMHARVSVNAHHNTTLEGILIDEMEKVGIVQRCRAGDCAQTSAILGVAEPTMDALSAA